MTTTKVSAADLARDFLKAARADGWQVTCRDSVVTIQKNFTPGDREAYVACDMTAANILGWAPLKGGSVWGTDGASVGGHAGLNGGYYRLNKSGRGSRFLNALAKLIAA